MNDYSPQYLSRWRPWILILLSALILMGCSDMKDQAKYEPLEASEFYADGRASRPLVAGTVPRGMDSQLDPAYSGKNEAGQFVDEFPFPVTREVVQRGRERYDIYCSPCHGYDGYGQGMIVQRGFPAPSSFHTDGLRQAPVGYFYDVITNGFGRMYSYAYRVDPDDRWAIAAYIRALQRSQNATQQDVPAEELQNLP